MDPFRKKRIPIWCPGTSG